MNRRVLLLFEFPTLLGGERSLLSTAPALQQAGFSLQAVAPPDGPLAEELAARNIDVLPLTTHAPHGERMPQHEIRRCLAERINGCRPHLIHANSLAMARLVGPVARSLEVSSIAHLRDMVRLSRRAWSDVCENTRLLAVSQAVRRFYVEKRSGLHPERLSEGAGAMPHVLYNGVDTRQFRPRAADGWLRRELKLGDGPLVGAIGQIGLRKGWDVLAAAAPLVTSQMPEVRFILIGQRWSQKQESRQLERSLWRLEADLPPGCCHRLGYRDDVARLLPELALLVHPARQEPLGRVLLEAAACGRAIVATDVGGTAEIFPPDSRTAVLIPPGDPAALAGAMLRLLRDERQRRLLGQAARRRIERHFDVARAASGLIGHYRALTG